MNKKLYSESDIAWSSIEKHIPYSIVVWRERKDNIPVYTFLDEDGLKIDINEYLVDEIDND